LRGNAAVDGVLMRKKTISLFMWGYQPHFRVGLQTLANSVLRALGIETEAVVLLVGVVDPNRANRNPICVEPENDRWSLDLFAGLIEDVERMVANHDLQNVIYSNDEVGMAEKPHRIRQDSVTTVVCRALKRDDERAGVRTFCGLAQLVGDHYVVSVIQVPMKDLERFDSLDLPPPVDRFEIRKESSFLDSALRHLLEDATDQLQRPDPGRSHTLRRSASEILRSAAATFMYTPGILVDDSYMFGDLFQRLNQVSSQMYEGIRGSGNLILAREGHSDIEYLLRFRSPVPFAQTRWVRKVLQMAAAGTDLIGNSESILGLGRRCNTTTPVDDIFTVEFLDHYHWELRCNGKRLLRSHYGEPTLPRSVIERDRFVANLARLFPTSTPEAKDRIWSIFNAAVAQPHGSMFIVAEDAAEEAERLAQQGTRIEPVDLTAELYSRVCGIDGTVILDPNGTCYAIGVILDGLAAEACTPSRGSRYNSAVRYVAPKSPRRLAVVASDDRTVDILPLLRPTISGAEVERNLQAFEAATIEDYHRPRSWLDTNRFYLSAEQCVRVNVALDRLEAQPFDAGEIRIVTSRFAPHPEFDDSYLSP
jgi:hypothetical protein